MHRIEMYKLLQNHTYLQWYPERQQPAQNYFLVLYPNLAEFGAFSKPRKC